MKNKKDKSNVNSVIVFVIAMAVTVVTALVCVTALPYIRAHFNSASGDAEHGDFYYNESGDLVIVDGDDFPEYGFDEGYFDDDVIAAVEALSQGYDTSEYIANPDDLSSWKITSLADTAANGSTDTMEVINDYFSKYSNNIAIEVCDRTYEQDADKFAGLMNSLLLELEESAAEEESGDCDDSETSSCSDSGDANGDTDMYFTMDSLLTKSSTRTAVIDLSTGNVSSYTNDSDGNLTASSTFLVELSGSESTAADVFSTILAQLGVTDNATRSFYEGAADTGGDMYYFSANSQAIANYLLDDSEYDSISGTSIWGPSYSGVSYTSDDSGEVPLTFFVDIAYEKNGVKYQKTRVIEIRACNEDGTTVFNSEIPGFASDINVSE